MKNKFFTVIAIVGWLVSSAALHAASAAPLSPLAVKVKAIMAEVQAKINQGLHTESDFAPELAEFDTLIAAHKSEKSNDLALTEYAKYVLYIQLFNEPDKGLAGYKQIVQDCPGTDIGKQIAQIIPQFEPQVRAHQLAQAAQKDLVVGKIFPEFAVKAGPVKDIAGKELALSQYKGKVVLVDFWATWCGPCMEEMPNVIAAYEKYHSKGFEIIGVSLDQPSGQATLAAFLAAHKMPWRQFCDGKYWQNELAVKYGIEAIPASYLLDGNGKIIALSPSGSALAPAIEDALAHKS
jgi:thiol-disulfide isomerase/thioredoxin